MKKPLNNATSQLITNPDENHDLQTSSHSTRLKRRDGFNDSHT